jgi:hypothetical protein
MQRVELECTAEVMFDETVTVTIRVAGLNTDQAVRIGSRLAAPLRAVVYGSLTEDGSEVELELGVPGKLQ